MLEVICLYFTLRHLQPGLKWGPTLETHSLLTLRIRGRDLPSAPELWATQNPKAGLPPVSSACRSATSHGKHQLGAERGDPHSRRVAIGSVASFRVVTWRIFRGKQIFFWQSFLKLNAFQLFHTNSIRRFFFFFPRIKVTMILKQSVCKGGRFGRAQTGKAD